MISSIGSVISSHWFLVGMVAYWVFSAAISSMPQPNGSGNFYKWLYGFLHVLAGDLSSYFGSKIPTTPTLAAQKGIARLGTVALCAVLSLTLVVAGCTIPVWVKDIENELPTIIDAIGGLLPILAALNQPGAANFLTKAQTDLTAANTLAKEFQPGSTASLAQVQALLADAQANLTAIDTFVPSGDRTLVATLIQDATNEINTIAADTAQTAVAGKFTTAPARKPLGRALFARTWNSHIKKTGDPVVDELSAKLHLSEHGFFVHVLTFDRVK